MRNFFSATQLIHSIILSRLVLDGPLHGYALASQIEDKNGWKPSQTTIYNTLKALKSQNAVTSEERVENGRAQRIYSITEEGRRILSVTNKKLISDMGKKFSQLLTIMQDFTNMDCFEEFDETNMCKDDFGKGMDEIPILIFKLLHVAPEETRKILSDTTVSLTQLAEKFDVSIEQHENRSQIAE